jgi:Phage Tail Collar Domain
MSNRIFAFAPLRAILIAALLNAALSAPTVAATDVAFKSFQGAWAADTPYSPGAVVTYNGASYICILQNAHFAPPTHPNYWQIMDAPGAMGLQGPPGPPGTQGIFGTNEITFQQGGSTGVTCNMGSIMLAVAVEYPTYYLPADGRLLNIESYEALYQLIGTHYGGDGQSTFALPDLRSAAPNNTQYLICVAGVFP